MMVRGTIQDDLLQSTLLTWMENLVELLFQKQDQTDMVDIVYLPLKVTLRFSLECASRDIQYGLDY